MNVPIAPPRDARPESAESDCADAFEEWEASGDGVVWDRSVGDGPADGPR
ncbi:hypothetical protein [Streptomyces liangshanensis]